jgi:signal transduction histidine kinase
MNIIKHPSNNIRRKAASTGVRHKPVNTTNTVLDKPATDEISLARHLLILQEAERQTVSRDLHDITGQSLTVLRLVLDKAAHCPPSELPQVLDEATALIDEAAERIRVVSRRLRPGILDLSLLGALKLQFEDFTQSTGRYILFQYRGMEGSFSQDISTAVYRIIQEALANAARRAGVSQIKVRVTAGKNRVAFRVADPGRRIDTRQQEEEKSHGMQEMQERAAMYGGWLEIKASTDDGTIITGELPLPSPVSEQ